jgi:putative restriction endonuclease
MLLAASTIIPYLSLVSTLHQFLNKLTKLNRGGTKYGKAPHKPVLLLAFIDLLDKGTLTQNQVYVDADLVGAFLENWQLLVDTLHSADFTQPFYYLQSDQFNGHPFWYLKAKPGCQVNAHIKSARILAQVVEYGHFAPEVFLLLADPLSRNLIKNTLLDTYFPLKKAAYLRSKQTGEGYVNDLTEYVLNEPEVPYKTLRVITEDEQFVRGGLFKKMVPKMYSNRCCITGMHVESTYGHTFIDACHIVPFSLTHNDTISNGIALCPNLHRAFDRGLITIDTGYRVKVSAGVIEHDSHPYNLKQFNDQPIHLPADRRYFPNPINLEWYGGNVFKG